LTTLKKQKGNRFEVFTKYKVIHGFYANSHIYDPTPKIEKRRKLITKA
jgi:hypothetical protein